MTAAMVEKECSRILGEEIIPGLVNETEAEDRTQRIKNTEHDFDQNTAVDKEANGCNSPCCYDSQGGA